MSFNKNVTESWNLGVRLALRYRLQVTGLIVESRLQQRIELVGCQTPDSDTVHSSHVQFSLREISLLSWGYISFPGSSDPRNRHFFFGSCRICLLLCMMALTMLHITHMIHGSHYNPTSSPVLKPLKLLMSVSILAFGVTVGAPYLC